MTLKNTIRIILTVLTLNLMPTAFAESDPKRGITIDDLSAIRDIKTVTVSPDGNYIAFQTLQAQKDTNDFLVSWYIAATSPGAEAVKVAEGTRVIPDMPRSGWIDGQFIPGEIIWSPDSEWIYFTKKENGYGQLWRSHRSQLGAEQLTDNDGDVNDLRYSISNATNVSGSNGAKVHFTIGRTRAQRKAFIKEEAKWGYLQADDYAYSIENGPRIPRCTDGQNRPKLIPLADMECLLEQWVYDLDTNLERRASEAELEALSNLDGGLNDAFRQGFIVGELKKLQKPSSDQKQVAWIENENPEVYKGYFPPMVLSASVKGETIYCPAEACKNPDGVAAGPGFRDLWWSPNGKEIIFQVRDGRHFTLSSFYGWTPGETTVRTILSNDDQFESCDLTGEQLVCLQETWISPKKIVSIDLGTGEITSLVDANPEFQNIEFTKIEKIFGQDNDGYEAHAHLVYPKGYVKGQQYPLVIVQYRSRGFLRGAVGDEQPIHVYAQNGIAVLSFSRPDYVPMDKTTDPMEINAINYKYGIARQGPATAIENLVDGLVGRGIVDPNRVGISGLSFGASNTDLALLRKNYAAASTAHSNITNIQHTASSSFLGKMYTIVYGDAAQVAEGLRKNSIDSNAERIDTPYLIQVADREYYITLHNYLALKDAGKPVEMIVYPDEYHTKWQPIHKYMVYSRNLDWFNFWLQGIEDPDPAKAEQYIRWRKLREMHEANLEKLEEEK